MTHLALDAATLRAGTSIVIDAMSPRLSAEAAGPGAFLTCAADAGGAIGSRLAVPLGRIADLARWTACYRQTPFWMVPCAGGPGDAMPRFEIQYLLVQRADGRFVLIVPLAHGRLRWSLENRPEGLHLVGETGDPGTVANSGLAAFVALGDDPYRLWPAAAEAVSARLASGRLRKDKLLPGFVDDFGWCTWDAFYHAVDAAKVGEGLASWRAAGITPRLLILDDGWQCEAASPTGEKRLTGLGANTKFGGSLRPLVRLAKDDYGIRTVMVWHAIMGYWGGIDQASLPAYQAKDTPRRYPVGIYNAHPTIDDWWGHQGGIIPPATIGRFYNDYHRWLRTEGVDGVKVDNQASLEGFCSGFTDRVSMTQAYREALEGSVATHFHHRLINCMSCATETWYQSLTSNLIRTSDDFWPNKPESHGLHLYTNAQVCTWFGEFMHADWDMFQSQHPMGAYHAAGRAVSGSPVYCSDKPGKHDVAVLRKLVCSDGTVLRFAQPGRPGRSSLMHDPTREDVALTIANRCAHGAAVGVFNARHHADPAQRTTVRARIGAGEVADLPAGEHVVWLHRAASVAGATAEVALAEGEFEVCTLAPVHHGRALIGPRGRFVPVLAVRSATWTATGLEAVIRDGGDVLLWGDRPRTVSVDGRDQAVAYDPATRVSTIATASGGDHTIVVAW